VAWRPGFWNLWRKPCRWSVPEVQLKFFLSPTIAPFRLGQAIPRHGRSRDSPVTRHRGLTSPVSVRPIQHCCRLLERLVAARAWAAELSVSFLSVPAFFPYTGRARFCAQSTPDTCCRGSALFWALVGAARSTPNFLDFTDCPPRYLPTRGASLRGHGSTTTHSHHRCTV